MLFKPFASLTGKIIFAILLIVLAWTAYLWLREKPAAERLQKIRPWVDRVYRLWPSARRRIASSIALLRPDLSNEQVQELSRVVAHTVGVNGAYMLGAERETVDDVKHRLKIGPGLVALAERCKKGEPAVVTLGHMVPFDGALGIAEILGIKVSIVVEKVFLPIRPIFNRTRASWRGLNLVPIRRGSTYQEIEARLKEGHLAVVLVDIFRQPRKEGTVVVPIGNASVGVTTMPASLARKNKVPLYTLVTEWDPREEIIFLEAVPFQVQYTDNGADDIRDAAERLGFWMGQQMIARPEHWLRSVWQELTPAA